MKVYLVKMFGVSLGLTLLLEWAVALALGIRGKKEFILVTLVNILTNPLAVLLYWLCRIYWAGASTFVQVVIEIAVVIVEAWIYHSFAKEEKWRIKRPVLLAMISNGVSWAMGLLLS